MPLNHPGLPHPLLDSLSHSFRKRKGDRNTRSDEARSFLNLFAWHLLLGLLMLPAPRIDTCEIGSNTVGKLQEKHGDNNATSIRQADVCLTIFGSSRQIADIRPNHWKPSLWSVARLRQRAELKKNLPGLYVRDLGSHFVQVSLFASGWRKAMFHHPRYMSIVL